jgi:hypothetical protein
MKFFDGPRIVPTRALDRLTGGFHHSVEGIDLRANHNMLLKSVGQQFSFAE